MEREPEYIAIHFLSLEVTTFWSERRCADGFVETAVGHYWSERRCADGFVETAVGHYFWYFSFLSLPPLLNWHKGVS